MKRKSIRFAFESEKTTAHDRAMWWLKRFYESLFIFCMSFFICFYVFSRIHNTQRHKRNWNIYKIEQIKRILKIDDRLQIHSPDKPSKEVLYNLCVCVFEFSLFFWQRFHDNLDNNCKPNRKTLIEYRLHANFYPQKGISQIFGAENAVAFKAKWWKWFNFLAWIIEIGFLFIFQSKRSSALLKIIFK